MEKQYLEHILNNDQLSKVREKERDQLNWKAK